MSGWRFYPVREADDCGLLVKGKTIRAAVFLTPQQAKSLQERKERTA